jgi:TPR repeat protein
MEKQNYRREELHNQLYTDINEAEKKAIYKEYLKITRYLAYRNNSNAQFDLAMHYEDIGYWGMNNPFYNPSKKYYWLNKAVKNGHPDACNSLAIMYEDGEFVKLDLEKSLELYKLGKKRNSIVCKRNLINLKKHIKNKTHSSYKNNMVYSVETDQRFRLN